MRAKTFLLMAGGTGGHVYPALATARMLQQRGDRVAWMGSKNGMEESVVVATGIPFNGLSVSGLRGKGAITLLLAPFKLLVALWQALVIIKKVKPDCVLGMGGFASGPGGLAAKLMGKPLIIHEQNAIAGMTNRLLSKLATSVMGAFPNAFPEGIDVKLTGNPLRDGICNIYYRAKPELAADRKIKVLVLGGSLGAAKLNECIPEALALLDCSIRPEVWHQTGANKLDTTLASYQRLGMSAKVNAYIDDMEDAYSWADFVICRAGALTISELCVAGLGAILVPYPFAVDDHQTLNARSMETAGAAWLVHQEQLNPDMLAEILRPLLEKRERITTLANAAHKLGKPEATEQVVAECRRVCYA